MNKDSSMIVEKDYSEKSSGWVSDNEAFDRKFEEMVKYSEEQ